MVAWLENAAKTAI